MANSSDYHCQQQGTDGSGLVLTSSNFLYEIMITVIVITFYCRNVLVCFFYQFTWIMQQG